MSETNEHAVTRAIERMHADLGEPLTIDDLAHTAMYSKFHFTRVFERTTGVSPGRFLSAIRLDEAKRLLRETNLTVTDISHRVGWSSVGSFSSRFSDSVGVSPSGYRRSAGPMPRPRTGSLLPRQGGVSTGVRGRVLLPEGDAPACIVVGLFRERIPQGRPAACVVLGAAGDYELSPAPVGNWHVLACALPPGGTDVADVDLDDVEQLLVGASNVVAIRTDTTMINVDVDLHPVTMYDPPVLLSFAHLRPTPTAKTAASPLPVKTIPAPRTGASAARSAGRRRPVDRGAGQRMAGRAGTGVGTGVGVDVLDAATMATPLAIRR